MNKLSLENLKLLGIIASILCIMPSDSIPLAGYLLLLVTIYYFSKFYKDMKIFTNFLLSFIFSLVGVILFILTLFLTTGQFLQNTLIRISYLSLFHVFGIPIIVLWLFLTIGAIFLKRSYNLLAEYTKSELFKLTGLLILIGSVLLIVIIGALIVYVGLIFQLISFVFIPTKRE